MRTPIAIVATLGLGVHAGAQSLTATGTMQANARAQNVFDSKFGGYPGTVTARAQSFIFSASASGSGSVSGLTARLSANASVFPWPSPSTSASAVVVAVLTYRADKPMAGVLDVQAPAGGTLDIGNTGKRESIRGSLQIPVVIGSAGLQVYAACGAIAVGGQSVTVRFDPKPGAVTPFGAPCATQLQGAWFPSSRGDLYFFQTSGAPDTPFHFLLLGTRRVSLPMPPSNCLLLTDFPIGIPIPISRGANKTKLVFPRISGLTLNAQILGSERPLPNVFWRTSNALEFKVK